MTTTPRLRRVASWTGGILAAATALTVAIHLGPVRKALGWKPLGVASATGGTNSGWCPFGFGAGGTTDPEGVASKPPRPHAAPDPSKAIAAARPALGFTLDVTTMSDVSKWAAQYGITCAPIKGGSTLQCDNIPAAALPDGAEALPIATAWFSFPFDDKLEVIKTIRRAPDPQAVADAFDRQQAELTAKAGAPSQRDGAKDAGELALGALRQAHVEFQFQNYRATVRATNMGPKGYMLSELYAAVL